MAQIVVRNLEPEVKEKLVLRAKEHGRSMEEEVRCILRGAVAEEGAPTEGLGTRIAKLFEGIGFTDEEVAQIGIGGTYWEVPDFDSDDFGPAE